VGSFAIVESVERATYCGILAPGVRRAVIRICGVFGKFATVVLDLGGDVASVIRRNYLVDAACKPLRPLVFDQGGGIGEMGALDVRVVEFANVAEDPVGSEL